MANVLSLVQNQALGNPNTQLSALTRRICQMSRLKSTQMGDKVSAEKVLSLNSSSTLTLQELLDFLEPLLPHQGTRNNCNRT